MLQLQVPPSTSRKPSFLQRSASVASLVAWKERFEAYSGKFTKQPSFISYATAEECMPYKLAQEVDTTPYNYGPENDPPPAYPATGIPESPPPPFPGKAGEEKQVCFQQDFTALETYLKKKLSIKKKSEDSSLAEAKLETAKVYQWIHELPEGDNLEEFLEAYGIPTKGVDMGDLKGKLKTFIDQRLAEVVDMRDPNEQLKNEADVTTEAVTPHWKRQISNMEDLAYEDNLEKWLESLDVPYFRPIPETKEQIRKYFNLSREDAKKEPAPPISSAEPELMPDTKELEMLVPKWKQLVEKMGTLKTEDELDQWLQSLEVPHNIQKEKIHSEIKKFFRHESFENYAGKSIVLKEHHIAKALWDKFEDTTLLKQIGIVAGTTAAIGIVAVLSTTMLSLAIPAAFAINPFFIEIFAQFFLQRQDVAFNLLNIHAQQAKPLSTAWAKQYVLWKYC